MSSARRRAAARLLLERDREERTLLATRPRSCVTAEAARARSHPRSSPSLDVADPAVAPGQGRGRAGIRLVSARAQQGDADPPRPRLRGRGQRAGRRARRRRRPLRRPDARPRCGPHPRSRRLLHGRRQARRTGDPRRHEGRAGRSRRPRAAPPRVPRGSREGRPRQDFRSIPSRSSCANSGSDPINAHVAHQWGRTPFAVG